MSQVACAAAIRIWQPRSARSNMPSSGRFPSREAHDTAPGVLVGTSLCAVELVGMAAGLGLTELLLIFLVATPSVLLPLLILYLVFRAGERRGAAHSGEQARDAPTKE